MFTWYELRTTDLDGAQAFYADVMGWQVQRSEAGCTFLLPSGEPAAGFGVLPERARMSGAPAHWLGHVAVPDVEEWTRRFIERGGEPRGPVRRSARGDVAALRDPQGAVLGLSSPASPISSNDGPSPAVSWHELHTTDAEQAAAAYAELLGLHTTSVLDLGLAVGPYRTFAPQGSERSVGGMLSTARLPQIHTHWLFYFRVDDLERALARTTALGGTVYQAPRTGPCGDLVAACEDAQGAVFGLSQRRDPDPLTV